MKNFIAPRSLSLPKGRLITIFLFAALFALSACDDSSSAGDDDNNVILSGDSREESSDSRSNDKDEAISSCGKSSDPAEVADDSSDSKGKPSSAGTSTKSSNSNTSGNDAKSSSSAGKVESSSSIGDVSKSYAETKVMPSGTFDCSKYNCFTTENLNQEFLEAGKYGEILDERDGQVYKTIQIGTQTWMAENLNYDPGQGGSGSSAYDWSWCYDDDPSNCDKYGRLYTWGAAMDSATTGCGYGRTCTATHPVQGICPSGWHLPTKVEWQTLIGGSSTAGKVLKSQTGWDDNGNGTDVYGFSALPAGYRINDDGNFSYGDGGLKAFFWSATEYSTEYSSNNAYYRYLTCRNGHAYLEIYSKLYARSVRCLKDSD